MTTMKLCKFLSFLSLILFIGFRFGILVDASNKEQPVYPFKTFKTEFGEIIDCIDVLKQPALSHPLLKHHKIQKRPRHFPKPSGEESNVVENIGFGQQQCPDGTIPIRRNTNESDPPRVQGETLPSPSQKDHFTAVLQIKQGRGLLGAKANIDTPNPKCVDGQSSAALIWISNGGDQIIAVGWRVDPRLYGDDRTHFSTYWSGGAGKLGCYDLLCPGFVQVDNRVTLGSVLPLVSIPGGQHYDIHVNISRDLVTKNWWLICTEANIYVGYWPGELFSELAKGASRLDFGGRVSTINGLPSPSMGSGVFPDRSNGGGEFVSFFTKVEYLDSNGVSIIPNDTDIATFLDCPNQFGLDYELSSDPKQGVNFLYGGPSGNCP